MRQGRKPIIFLNKRKIYQEIAKHISHGCLVATLQVASCKLQVASSKLLLAVFSLQLAISAIKLFAAVVSWVNGKYSGQVRECGAETYVFMAWAMVH